MGRPRGGHQRGDDRGAGENERSAGDRQHAREPDVVHIARRDARECEAAGGSSRDADPDDERALEHDPEQETTRRRTEGQPYTELTGPGVDREGEDAGDAHHRDQQRDPGES